MLHPDFWRKGIMKEAVLAAIDYGFNTMKLHSIEAHINPANAASAAVLEATGFVREAYFKEDFYYKGKFTDSAIYSLLTPIK
jgi:ribosomal-protein-alanine N-acetyltransferase